MKGIPTELQHESPRAGFKKISHKTKIAGEF